MCKYKKMINGKGEDTEVKVIAAGQWHFWQVWQVTRWADPPYNERYAQMSDSSGTQRLQVVGCF